MQCGLQALQLEQLYEVQQAAEDSSGLQAEAQCLQSVYIKLSCALHYSLVAAE